MITISIENRGRVKAAKSGEEEVYLIYKDFYAEEDEITIAFPEPGYYQVQTDIALLPALLWCEGTYYMPVPSGDLKLPYYPYAFSGDIHLVTVRRAREKEITNYRNLALNPADWHGNRAMYPHTHANVETRGESVFASRNAVDGLKAADSHGLFPWSSWGINRNPEAEITVDFGRPVDIDLLALYTRADFPHDAWWTEGSVRFSDGSEIKLGLSKKDGAQTFPVDKKGITSLTLFRLVKADDPSPFPALTQIEAWGTESGR